MIFSFPHDLNVDSSTLLPFVDDAIMDKKQELFKALWYTGNKDRLDYSDGYVYWTTIKQKLIRD